MLVQDIINDYLSSHDFSALRDETQQHYKYLIYVMVSTKPDNEQFGWKSCEDVTTRMAKQLYNKWCEKGIPMANHVLSVTRIVFNYAVHMENCLVNPFSAVKKRTTQRRKTVWTREQVRHFLDTAYSDFNTRNIGLIAHMAYEWCQRLGDIRLLKWENLDLDKKMVYIEQSKRRAEVFLPMSDDLHEMLVQQQEDFGFQPYVAPSIKPKNGNYYPYSLQHLPRMARRVMDSAELPKELRLSDLRRTGTTEMVEAGVSMGNIMSVTGHANPQSVKPYMKNTLASADLALTARQNHGR